MSKLPALYEIATNYRQLLDLDIPEDQLADTLLLVADEFQEKAKQIGFVLSTMDEQEAAITKHLDHIKAKLETVKNRKQRLKDYLQHNMEDTGITKIECPYFAISLQKSPESVVVDDEALIPADYFETKTVLSKSNVKKALQDGYAVPGAHLERGNHVRIR